MRLIPQRIDFLTKIIEAYDHLGIVSTIDPKAGLVIIRGTEDSISEIREIVANLPFSLEEIPELEETTYFARIKSEEED